MEWVEFDVDCGQFDVGDFLVFWVDVFVEFVLDFEFSFGCSCCNEIDDDLMCYEGFVVLVLGDE